MYSEDPQDDDVIVITDSEEVVCIGFMHHLVTMQSRVLCLHSARGY